MAEGDQGGWWTVSARPAWTCPECKVTSPAKDWETCEPGCEDCGSHDGRQCPACGEEFDHVWGAPKIEEASEETERAAREAHREQEG